MALPICYKLKKPKIGDGEVLLFFPISILVLVIFLDACVMPLVIIHLVRGVH